LIGKALAYLCLQVGDLKNKNLADKAAFLESLGLDRKEAAGMLGTTAASITETLSRVKRAKGAKKGAKKDASRKRKGR
jgi:hypothetical protein